MTTNTCLGEIDMEYLRDEAAYHAIGTVPDEGLSPYGMFRLHGCIAYADWVAYDRVLAPAFIEEWQEATGLDWAALTPRQRADALACEEASHHRADVDLVSDDFMLRMTECIGEETLRRLDLKR